jgi:uncharacterized protein (DUF983 family)
MNIKDRLKDKNTRINLFTFFSLFMNFAYALYNLFLGIGYSSFWFCVMFVYYLILGIAKLCSLLTRKKHPQDEKKQYQTMKIIGFLFIPLMIIMSTSIALTMKYSLYTSHTKIIMITIAVYTTYRVTNSIINFYKTRKAKDVTLYTIRNINIAEALISLLNLQMTMFASFDSEDINTHHIMNIATGAVVCVFILILGILMIVISFKKIKSIKKDQI